MCVTGRHIQEAPHGALEVESEEGKRVKRFGKTGLVLVLAGGVAALAISAAATASTTRKAASIQVCVLLPDTKSSVRWTQFDPKYIGAALKKANVTYKITNALNDPLKQKAQAQACLAAGAKGVIEVSLDNGSASSIEKLFTSKGGFAIDYDRQVIGGTASDYVAFDGVGVGAAQANGIIAAMKKKGTYKPSSTVAELWGGQTDQNAFWFKSGNDKVLNPLFKSGALKKGPTQFVPDWDANNAATIFNQMLVKTSNNVQGIIAANDNIAGAVIADLKAKHLKPIPISGQDASPQGIQYILAGWQSGTVYKFVPDEANAAAAAAVALVKGTTPKTNGFRLNGKAKEPTLALPVVWITKSNYTRLFTDKFLKKSQVCIGAYAQFCK